MTLPRPVGSGAPVWPSPNWTAVVPSSWVLGGVDLRRRRQPVQPRHLVPAHAVDEDLERRVARRRAPCSGRRSAAPSGAGSAGTAPSRRRRRGPRRAPSRRGWPRRRCRAGTRSGASRSSGSSVRDVDAHELGDLGADRPGQHEQPVGRREDECLRERGREVGARIPIWRQEREHLELRRVRRPGPSAGRSGRSSRTPRATALVNAIGSASWAERRPRAASTWSRSSPSSRTVVPSTSVGRISSSPPLPPGKTSEPVGDLEHTRLLQLRLGAGRVKALLERGGGVDERSGRGAQQCRARGQVADPHAQLRRLAREREQKRAGRRHQARENGRGRGVEAELFHRRRVVRGRAERHGRPDLLDGGHRRRHRGRSPRRRRAGAGRERGPQRRAGLPGW